MWRREHFCLNCDKVVTLLLVTFNKLTQFRFTINKIFKNLQDSFLQKGFIHIKATDLLQVERFS